MSQVAGYLVLAAVVIGVVWQLLRQLRAERQGAYLRWLEDDAYHASRPMWVDPRVDRVQVLRDLVGDGAAPPRGTPGDSSVANLTRASIGRVRTVAAMSPCDGVVCSPFFSDRDFGDETGGVQ